VRRSDGPIAMVADLEGADLAESSHSCPVRGVSAGEAEGSDDIVLASRSLRPDLPPVLYGILWDAMTSERSRWFRKHETTECVMRAWARWAQTLNAVDALAPWFLTRAMNA
jgi:hypothetical protein